VPLGGAIHGFIHSLLSGRNRTHTHKRVDIRKGSGLLGWFGTAEEVWLFGE